ncbi:MAG TPA: shikimate kinase [Bryocella sp.]|nr:shikimate kinase [Bryocella sp.]
MPPIPAKSSDHAHARPPLIERIVLTGFMGSGKSTIGRRLAERLRWRFVDLDHFIEKRDGRTVARIFAESGEPAFRALETEALISSLQQSHIVIALGGGALETPANRHALSTASSACVVLLSAEFDTLFDRCQHQITTAVASGLPVRPLLGDREAAAARLARREPIYREAAHVILDTTGQSPEESVEALLTILGSIP